MFLNTVFLEGSKVALAESDEIQFSSLVILNVALFEQNYDFYLEFPQLETSPIHRAASCSSPYPSQ